MKLTSVARPKKLHFGILRVLQDEFAVAGRKGRYLPKEVLDEGLHGPRTYGDEDDDKKRAELLLQGRYDTSADAYALGLLMWEMLSGQLAFQAEIDANQVGSLEEFLDKIVGVDCRPAVPDLNMSEPALVRWFTAMQTCWSVNRQSRPQVFDFDRQLFPEQSIDCITFRTDHF